MKMIKVQLNNNNNNNTNNTTTRKDITLSVCFLASSVMTLHLRKDYNINHSQPWLSEMHFSVLALTTTFHTDTVQRLK